MTRPTYSRERLGAVEMPVALVDAGRTKAQRLAFAAALSTQSAMQHA